MITQQKVNSYIKVITDLLINGDEKQKLISKKLIENPLKLAKFIEMAEGLNGSST